MPPLTPPPWRPQTGPSAAQPPPLPASLSPCRRAPAPRVRGERDPHCTAARSCVLQPFTVGACLLRKGLPRLLSQPLPRSDHHSLGRGEQVRDPQVHPCLSFSPITRHRAAEIRHLCSPRAGEELRLAGHCVSPRALVASVSPLNDRLTLLLEATSVPLSITSLQDSEWESWGCGGYQI